MTKTEISKELNIRPSTLKYYTEIGLIPYQQKDKGLRRDYSLSKVTDILQKIEEMKKEGKTIKEIVTYFNQSNNGLHKK